MSITIGEKPLEQLAAAIDMRFTGDCNDGRIISCSGYGWCKYGMAPAATEVQYRTYFDDDYKSVSKVE